MDLCSLLKRFRQFGGFRLAIEYARLGLTLPLIKAFGAHIFKRKSLKSVYIATYSAVDPVLRDKYKPVMESRKEHYLSFLPENSRKNIVWVCWLQGIGNAPDVVKACRRSVSRHFNDWDIKDIDATNWKDYVSLPDHVVKKWEDGMIPPALFTDLLRLELLIRYGGIWLDATVLITGDGISKDILEADLFLPRYTEEDSPGDMKVSNWLISACPGNKVLLVLRDMLFEYWKDYDCVMKYYIFHLFFSMLAEAFPEEIAAMPFASSRKALSLLRHWNEPYDENRWEDWSSKVCFHKLSARPDKKTIENKTNFYNTIILK